MQEQNEFGASLKLLAKSSIIVFIGVVLSKVLTYVYKIIVARNFNPSEFGRFSLAIMVFGLVVAFASLGLTEGLLRYVSLYRKKDVGKVKYLFKFSLIVSIISSVFAGVVLFLLSDFIAIGIFSDSGLIIYLRVISLIIPLFIVSGIFLSVIRAFENITSYTFIVNVFENGVKLVALIVLILAGVGRSAIVLSYLFGAVGLLAVSYLASRKYLSQIIVWKGDIEDKSSLRGEFLSYSWPIIFMAVVGSFFYWTDSFVIGYFSSSADVGFYGVAFSVVALLGIAPELFMQMFFPLIVREFSNKKIEVIRELSKQVTKWIFILNIPLFVMMILFPGAIINILFGEAYLSGQGALRVLALGSFVSSLFVNSSNSLLSMRGKSKLILTNVVVISIFNLILNILLIPKFGLLGAAYSTTASWIILNSVLLIEVNHYLSIIPLRKRMVRIGLVSIIPIALLVFLKDIVPQSLISLVLVSVLFFLFHLLLVFVSGGLDKNDLIIVLSIKSKFFKESS